METYINVNVVNAKPMTRQEYNDLRGWKLPEDEDGSDAGYLIEKHGKPNHREYEGYISWLPEHMFKTSHEPCYDKMNFGLAIEAAKQGHKITRAGWNGKGMWVAYMEGMKLPPFNSQEPGKKVNDRTAALIGPDTPLETLPYFAMWTVNAEGRRAWLPGWLASQTDMLAEDWMIVE